MGPASQSPCSGELADRLGVPVAPSGTIGSMIGAPHEDAASLLSARETQVLELGAQGLTRTQMAEQLGVTVSTVKYHLASAYRKLAVTNRSEAVARLLGSRQA
jgi:two-component system, NarL family, nitrate/nitrite response regulator NarL